MRHYVFDPRTTRHLPVRRLSWHPADVAPAAGGRGSVYVLKAGVPQEVQVRTGRSDGRFTEITKGELNEGDEVIVGTAQGDTDGKAGR